ncbi:MAG TPA: ABC transporter permease [Lachnospiraceae bacterium]|nr:ABC transporter permease [Lachnospiraceae bacterium]
MYRIKNKKVIRTLSDKSLRAAKERNIIAVLAIALTAMLFTTLFTAGSGIMENLQRQTMRQAGGDGMAVLKYVSDETYEKVKNHPLIKEISYNRILSSSVDNEALLKRHGELYYMDDVGIRLGFCEPTTGSRPKAENEIIMDTRTMQLLGVEQRIGAPVTLELTVHGRQVTREFVLSGWWEADPVFNVSMLVASRAYVDVHIEELYNSYEEDWDMTGVINCYIMFHNSLGIEGKLDRVVTESGYSRDEDAGNYISCNVNWSYLSANMKPDAVTIAGVLSALLLILLAGYLIIYNIFQISVIKDIRFYGLLKTIGATGKQIKKLIHRQALLLSCVGIPAGLIMGWFLGCFLVPVVMSRLFLAGNGNQTSANPFIFLGSTLFALVTVSVSVARPGRIAARVSPVEAVRYTDRDGKYRKKERHSERGARIFRMAAANLLRNQKRTLLVILSMSLSLVLFNTLYTFSLGFDMDKYLSKFVDTDFLIGHGDYFNYRYTGPENALSESMIEAVEQQPGFLVGGRLLTNVRSTEGFTVETDDVSDGAALGAVVYGLEDLPLGRLEVLEGSIDEEKLKSGNYILEGIQLDDNERPYWETSHFAIGDTVTLHTYEGVNEDGVEKERIVREFEVMAKVKIKYYTNSCLVNYDYSFYLPAEIYQEMITVPGVMSYAFNVEEGTEQDMESFLSDYTEHVEPVMNYSSKSTRTGEFQGMRNMVLLVGGALSLVTGLIGILNFINSVLTSILTRRKEFAMLRSVGMTGRQLLQMLMAEGMYYAIISGGVSLAIGTALSLGTVKNLGNSLWFFSYRFTVLPILLTIPILLAVGAVLPWIVLKRVERQSIVERLREGEE